MKAGDLLRHNGNHSLWLLLEVESEECTRMAFETLTHTLALTLLIVSTKTGHKMWANPRAFEVISRCQENVKSTKKCCTSLAEGYIIERRGKHFRYPLKTWENVKCQENVKTALFI